MTLDLSSLRDAIAQGDEALAYCRSDPARSDSRLALHLRAAAIQAFEFTYELTIKTLRRFLTEVEADPAAVQASSFNDLIRRGYDLGLLRAELADWRAFRRDRGTAGHAYDAAKAQAIFEGIPAFLAEARFLVETIEARQCRGRHGGPLLNPAVDVREADVATVWAILKVRLPADATVRVFGSRAWAEASRGGARRGAARTSTSPSTPAAR